MSRRRFLSRVADWIIRFHLPIVIATGVMIVGLSIFAPGVKYTENIEKFLPEGPETELFQKINKEFGGLNIALVGLTFDDLFTHDNLARVQGLTKALSGIPGVFHINSLTNTIDLTGNELGATVKVLVPEIVPKEKSALEKIRKKALSRKMIAGTLVSHDGKSALLVCVLRGDADMKGVAERLKAATIKLVGSKGVYFGGSPFLAEYMANGAQRDLQRLTPFVCAVILLIMFYLFRRPAGVVLSTACIVTSISCTFGVMNLFGLTLNLLSSSLPIIILAVGSAYSIHILTKYYDGYDAGLDRDGMIHLIFDEVSVPVLVAGVTTMIGFMSFYVMDIQPMREFGLLIGLGIFFSMLFSAVSIPAVLYMLAKNGGSQTAVPHERRGIGDSLLEQIGRRKHGLAALTVVVVVISLYYTTKIDVDMSTKHLYQKNTEPWLAERFLGKQFGGSIYLQLYVSGDMRDPIVLKELERLNDYIAVQDNVAGIQSLVEVVKILNKGFTNSARIPESKAKLSKDLLTLIDGEPWLKMLVNRTWSAALINIKLAEFDSLRINRLIARINDYTRLRSPGRLFAVDAESIPQTLAEKVREYRVKETLERLSLQLAAHRISISQAYLARAMRRARAVDPKRFLDVPTAKVTAYLTGDEAAVDLTNPAEAKRVSTAIIALIDAGKKRDATLAYLRGVVKPEFRNDKKNLTTANETIWETVRTLRRQYESKEIAAPLLAAIPPAQRSHEIETLIRTTLLDITDANFNAAAAPFRAKLPTVARSMSIRISGYPVLYEGMNRSVRRNNMNSAMVSLVLVFIVLALLFRSIVWGLIAIGPTTITLLFTFGLMGVLKIPLDMGSSMITSITLGVGIDYSIHFLWRLRRLGKQTSDLAATMATTGRAIVFNAVTVTVGFSILIFASIVPIIKLGGLTAETMFMSALLTLVLIPLVFHLFEPYLLARKKES
ncbi:MAG: MMPL family transporter [Myxococcales bacterium]|nr:MMPL family transporter [Myxococcales bacterium]